MASPVGKTFSTQAMLYKELKLNAVAPEIRHNEVLREMLLSFRLNILKKLPFFFCTFFAPLLQCCEF